MHFYNNIKLYNICNKKNVILKISFSDISIKLIDQEIPAHKFILSARTDFFSDTVLVEKTVLGNILSIFF